MPYPHFMGPLKNPDKIEMEYRTLSGPTFSDEPEHSNGDKRLREVLESLLMARRMAAMDFRMFAHIEEGELALLVGKCGNDRIEYVWSLTHLDLEFLATIREANRQGFAVTIAPLEGSNTDAVEILLTRKNSHESAMHSGDHPIAALNGVLRKLAAVRIHGDAPSSERLD